MDGEGVDNKLDDKAGFGGGRGGGKQKFWFGIIDTWVGYLVRSQIAYRPWLSGPTPASPLRPSPFSPGTDSPKNNST
jgi:hypothetical protein